MKRDGSSFRLSGDDGDVTITVVTPRIVRVRLETDDVAVTPSYVAPQQRPPVAVDVREGEPARLLTPHLQVEISTRPLRLAFLDARSEWVLREPPDGGMGRGPRDADGPAATGACGDRAAPVARSPAPGSPPGRPCVVVDVTPHLARATPGAGRSRVLASG